MVNVTETNAFMCSPLTIKFGVLLSWVRTLQLKVDLKASKNSVKSCRQIEIPTAKVI